VLIGQPVQMPPAVPDVPTTAVTRSATPGMPQICRPLPAWLRRFDEYTFAFGAPAQSQRAVAAIVPARDQADRTAHRRIEELSLFVADVDRIDFS